MLGQKNIFFKVDAASAHQTQRPDLVCIPGEGLASDELNYGANKVTHTPTLDRIATKSSLRCNRWIYIGTLALLC